MEEMRYTISDAAKMVKVESHVLRYWEDELALEIPRNEMGHRYYTQREIDVFCQIRALKDRGFQLKAIKDVLEIMFEEDKNTNIISLNHVRQNFVESEEKTKKSEEKMRKPEENMRKAEEKMKKPEEKHQRSEEKAQMPVKENVKETAAAEFVKAESVEAPAVVGVSPAEKMSHFKYIMDGIVSQALQANNLKLEESIACQVAERLLREMDVIEQEREQREEARFRKLDEAIRGRQRGYQEAAAAKLPPYTPTKMNKRHFSLFRR